MFQPSSKLTWRILFLCLALTIATTGNAQRLKVSLDVGGPDDSKGKIFNYLVADLAKRGVDLVAAGAADYQIRMIAAHLESKKGRGAGYAVSVAVIAPERRASKHPLVAHFLEVGPRDGLEDLCKRVADGINDTVLAIHPQNF